MVKKDIFASLKHRSTFDFAIGIDTGVHTGYAEWDCKNKEFVLVKTMKIHEAIFRVQERIRTWKRKGFHFVIRVEDARQRKWFTDKYAKDGHMRNIQQGAGSVKRDASVWEDFLKDENVDFDMVPPKNNATKMTEQAFRGLCHYQGRTSEHGRDAAMLVFGY